MYDVIFLPSVRNYIKKLKDKKLKKLFEEAIEEYKDVIMQETLCEQMLEKNDLKDEYNLNGIVVKLDVEQR